MRDDVDCRDAQVLVVQPDEAGPLGRWDGWLREDGLDIRLVRPFAGDAVPKQVTGSGLIVLGGAMSVHDTAAHEWLDDIGVLLRSAVEVGVPTLGICLGGQLLSQALGGAVTVGPAGVEAGIAQVRLQPEARSDALLGGLDSFPMGSLHVDMIDVLPAGACWLASSDLYRHQAFRIGAAAWGVQFHPEISPNTYSRWARSYGGVDPGDLKRVEEGISRFESKDDEVSRIARLLARRFAHTVLAFAHSQRVSSDELYGTHE